MSFDILGKFLTNVEVFDKFKKKKFFLDPNAFSRKCKMSFSLLIIYILSNKGRTSVVEINDFFKTIKRTDMVPISKQGLSKRRLKLNPLVFKSINRYYLKRIYRANKKKMMTFKGFYVFAVDGSELELPKNKISIKEFKIKLKGLRKVKLPKIRSSTFYDVLNGYILDSEISEKEIGERKLASKHIDCVYEYMDLKQSIVIFDRGYEGLNLVLKLAEKNANFIFRLTDKMFKQYRKKTKAHDYYITVPLKQRYIKNMENDALKRKAEQKREITLRIIKFKLKNGETETLLTNLPPKIASKNDLKELYRLRWKIETNYDYLKNHQQLENFSGLKRTIIEQDFYAQMLIHNIANSERIHQQSLLNDKNKKEEDTVYKVNNKLLFGEIKNNLTDIFFAKTKSKRKKISKSITKTIQRYPIKIPENMDMTRNTDLNKNKFPQTRKKAY